MLTGISSRFLTVWWRRTALGTGGVLLVSVSACLSNDPVSSGFQDVPSQVVTVPPSQSFFIPTHPTSDITNPAEPVYVSTGITVPTGMSVRMHVSGAVTATPNASCGGSPGPSFPLYFEGIQDGSLGALGALRVGWFLGPIGGGQLPNHFTAIDAAITEGMATYSPDLMGNGPAELIFRRQPWIAGCAIGGTPSFLLSGGQTVQVDFASMNVQVNDTSIVSNQSLTFTASPVNFTPVDPSAVFWVYYPDGSQIGTNIVACNGQSTCVYAPTARGRMMAINEVVVGFSATIEVICATGDSILDSDAARALLKVAWDSSNAFDPIKLNRRERGGYLFRDALGNLVYKTYFSTSDGPCKSNVTPTGTLPGPFVAGFHTHPFSGDTLGSGMGEETTGICSTAVPGLKKFYDATSLGGPSSADFNRATSDSLPHYLMDKDNIYYFPPGTTPANWKTRVKKYPRTAPGCIRP
jgi:hypothetical protein